MYQVPLISALSAAVLVATVAWSMRMRHGLSVPHDARRVQVAVERASWAALRRRAYCLPWAAGWSLVLVLLAHFVLRPISGSGPNAFALIGSAVTFAFGLVSAFAVAWLCGHHVRRRSFLCVSGAAVSADRCLTATVSSAAVLAVASDVLGMLSTAGIYGLLWLLARGMANTLAPSGDSMLAAIRIAPYFGVGVTLAALGLGQSGAGCVGATKLIGSSAFETRTGLPTIDPRNPTVLVTAVASQLGSIVPKVLDSFVGAALLTSISFQLAYVAPQLGWATGAAGIATLPILLRCFGLLASLFGLFTLRTTEHEGIERAFFRGQLVAHVVQASAIAGVVVWLFGTISVPVGLAAIVGLLLASFLGRLRTFLLTRVRQPRLSADENKHQSLLIWGDASAAALLPALLPTLLYPCGLGLFAFWFLRTSASPLEQGAALLIGFAAPSSLAAWNLAVSLGRELETVGVLSAGVGRLPLSPDCTHRLRRLADATDRVVGATDPVSSDAGALLCGLSAVVCQLSHQHRTLPASALVPMLLGISLWALLPGLFATIASIRTGTRTARTQAYEVERQLRGMRRDGTQVLIPDDYVPSYRSCVELLARDSANGRLGFAVLGLALPLSVASLGALIENIPGLAPLGLASYAAIAAAAGLFAMHVGHAAAVASSLANRGGAPSWLPVSPPAVSISEPLRMVEFLGQSIGVSVPLLTKAVALATLAFSALLI